MSSPSLRCYTNLAVSWILLLVSCGTCAAAASGAVPSSVLYAAHASKPSGHHRWPSAAAWLHTPATGIFARAINRAACRFNTVSQYHTRVQMLWTTSTLYVRFTCCGAAHGITFHANNQLLYQQDVMEIFLDVVGNMKNYVEIEVSPHGFHTVFRHHWTIPPTYPAAHINWTQVAKNHHGSPWHIPGLRTMATVPKKIKKKAQWAAILAIPIEPICKISHTSATLHIHQRLRANFIRYVYLPNGHGQRILHQLNWIPTMLGDPHVSPMAMGTIILSGRAGATKPDHSHLLPP